MPKKCCPLGARPKKWLSPHPHPRCHPSIGSGLRGAARGIGAARLPARSRISFSSIPSVARPLRYLPPDCPLVEVTCRTIHGRMLLRPSRELNRRVLGVLARAARRYQMGVCYFIFLSNHCHLLLRPTSAQQLASFMNYLNSNIAREAGRLHRWREKFWGRRYRAIPVSFEPEAQIDRLRYLLSQGCKEGLVAKPQEWPGATSVHAQLGDGIVTGTCSSRGVRHGVPVIVRSCRSSQNRRWPLTARSTISTVRYFRSSFSLSANSSAAASRKTIRFSAPGLRVISCCSTPQA